MKVVINRGIGGFGLSVKASVRYLEIAGNSALFYEHVYDDATQTFIPHKVDSTDDPYGVYTIDLGESFTADNIPEGAAFDVYSLDRTDPILIQVVEELGTAANDGCILKIVEIPDDIDWYIDEDGETGIESIHEEHRSWN